MVTLYEASQYPFLEPKIITLELGELAETKVSRLATLYIAPMPQTKSDESMLEALGITAAQIKSHRSGQAEAL